MLSRLTLLTFILALSCQAIVAQTGAKPNDIERRAFEQTNTVRVRNGLPPFAWDDEVCRMRSRGVASPPGGELDRRDGHGRLGWPRGRPPRSLRVQR